MSKKTVLVLNAGLEPLHNVTPEHAIGMLFRGVALVYKEHETEMFGPFQKPLQMVLKRYIKLDWYYANPLVWSKSGIMRRDNWTCAYCGNQADTIDHVVPVSKGGSSTWEGTVAACFSCNNKKSDRTLDEMGWTLMFTPIYPRRDQLMTGSHRQ